MSRIKALLTKRLSGLALVTALGLSASSVMAGSSVLNTIQWNGFISQGFAYSDDNNYLGDSSSGSFRLTEAGLNTSWRPHSKLQISAQALYRQTGTVAPDNIELDYGVIDWSIYNSMKGGFGLRAGRLKNPYGFYNEPRDLAHTRPTVLLPESIYIDYLRDLIHSVDGFGIYSHRELPTGTLSFSAVNGDQDLNQHTISTIALTPNKGDLKDIDLTVSRIQYEHGTGAWRLAYSHVEFESEFAPAPTDVTLFSGATDTTQQLLSFEYNYKQWQFVTEYQFRDYTVSDIHFPGLTINFESEGYYAQLSYRISNKWKVLLRRDDIYLRKDDKSGQLHPAFAGQPSHDAYAKDHTLSLKYTPTPEWQFMAEWHNVLGTYWLPSIENPAITDRQASWNLFLLHAAYRF
ncbi:MAG: hypothetical protein K6L73_01890 [Cellvibrionaceae bacterium]